MAARDIRKLPRPMPSRVKAAISALAEEPRPHGSLKLSDREATWRIRVGDYRVLYEIHDDRLLVLVIRVRHRREVYR